MSGTPDNIDRAADHAATSPKEKAIDLPSVLIVDDQPARVLACEAILADLPVRCVRAFSGEECLVKLLKQDFAAIVLDVSMPTMDGFETARLIRTHHRYQKTPILFLTGVHLSELDQLKGYEAGAIDYLPIPIVPEILRSKIAILLELYLRRRELEELTQALVSARSHCSPSAAVKVPDLSAHPAGIETTQSRTDNDVLLDAAHDLRNALAPMYYLIEVLLRKTTPANPMHPVLQIIREYTLRISHLVDDFEHRNP